MSTPRAAARERDRFVPLGPYLAARSVCSIRRAAGASSVNAVPAEERWLVDLVDYPERLTEPGVRIVIGNVFEVELPPASSTGCSRQLARALPLAGGSRSVSRPDATHARAGRRVALMGPNFKYCAREYFDCADHLLVLTHVSVRTALHLGLQGDRSCAAVPAVLVPGAGFPRGDAAYTCAGRCSGRCREAVPDPRPRRKCRSGTHLPFWSANPLVRSCVRRVMGDGGLGRTMSTPFRGML